MSATGLEVFDKTLQLTNAWIDDVADDLGCGRRAAWHVLVAVLAALRERLPERLSAHLAAGLPLLVRGAYFQGWRPAEQHLKLRRLPEFLDLVAGGLGRCSAAPDEAVTAVFSVLHDHLDPSITLKVRAALPEEVRELWPDPDLVPPHRAVAENFDEEGRALPRADAPRYY